MSDKPKKDMDITRKVWLAGIGAYGRALGDAQEAYAKMGKETSKVFDELVGRGADLEGKVKVAAKQYTPKMAEETVRATVDNVSDRMDRMKAALGLTEAAAEQQDQITGIEARLDIIESKIDAILEAVGPTKPAKAKTRKPAAKKATPKKPKSK